MRRLSTGLLLLGALASLASSGRGDFVVHGETGFFDGREDTAPDPCAEGLDVLCVTTRLDGTLQAADTIEVLDAEQILIEDLSCASSSCCSEDLEGGTWVVVATLEGQTMAEPVVVPSYEDCPESTLSVVLDFEGDSSDSGGR